jgi:8-oxo-dGTP diphosphatase
MENPIPNCFYRVSIKALILNDKGEFLLIQEANRLWELPGGGMDFGENPEQTLQREIKEEMGLEVQDIESQPSYFFSCINPKGQHIVNVVYKAYLKHLDFVPSDECMALGYFDADTVLHQSQHMYPNVLAFAKMLKDRILL